MTILSTFGGASGVDTGDIPASLRFRNAASSYCNRLFGSPTSTTKWSFSTWVKLGNLGQRHFLLVGWNGASDRGYLEINDSGVLRYDDFYSSSQRCLKVSTPVYRDPTGWLHIVCEADTGNATAEDRLRIYVNGVRVTSWSTNTNYTVSTATQINWASHQHYIGWLNSMYGDDYRARTAFVDNGGGGPTAYAQFNTEINEWVSKSQSAVKAVVDAGGTNSFMLDFDDPNFATYSVGKDYSSKGNHWTPNNFSLTAGTTYDWMLDVPGNSFATLNPLSHTSVTETNGNLTTSSFSLDAWSIGTLSASTGKWYAEIAMTAFTVAEPLEVGVTRGNSMRSGGAWTTGATLMNNAVVYDYGGNKRVLGSSSAYGATWTTNDVIGIAFDIDGGTVTFYKNGVSQGTISQSLSGYEWAVVVANQRGGGCTCTVSLHNGAAPLHASATYDSASGGYFRYTPPSGYKALCQRNMPDPAILNPEKHFETKIRAGDGTSPKVLMSDLLFSPDFIWTKDRNTGYQHTLQDRVRGTGASGKLYSSLTEAEGGANSVYGHISSFDAAGVTATVGSSGFQHINANAVTYVDWLWKAGGAAVTNNAGSISSQVSANVEAGFSIVTYTGTGANATVGHGLGVAPKLVIVKQRNGSTYSWTAHHDALSAGQVLFLEATAAATARATSFNSTDPSSIVFSLGTDLGTNANGNTYVAYCFAEIPGYSKIFSYTGNGSADGTFVPCGFKPKFILLKNASAAGNGWIIYDAVRNTYNVMDLYLQPNTSSAEGAAAYIDAVSNGFKVRTANADANGSTNTIVGIAFADVPGKYSLAR